MHLKKRFPKKTVLAAFWILAGTGCLRCCDVNESDPLCEESCTPAPSGCERSLSAGARLELTFSRPLPVEVHLYEGEDFETGRLARAWTPTDTAESLLLPYNKYSATALYVRGGDTVLVVGAGGVGYETRVTCDGECYEARNGDMDLELK